MRVGVRGSAGSHREATCFRGDSKVQKGQVGTSLPTAASCTPGMGRGSQDTGFCAGSKRTGAQEQSSFEPRNNPALSPETTQL